MNIRTTYNNLPILHPLVANDQNHKFDRTRVVAEDSRQQTQARTGNSPSDFVFRGELLDSVSDHNRNRTQPNQQVSPSNRLAIERYMASDSMNLTLDSRGQLLDQYV